MLARDVIERLDNTFSAFYSKMDRSEFVLAEKGAEKLSILQYKKRGDDRFPLKKAAFLILEKGWVWNKDNKELLDEDEIVAGAFVPIDEIPLPMLILEISIHVGKYDHLNIDLFPISKDARYKALFSAPVNALRQKNDDIPGLLKGTVNPGLLDDYTSGGMLAGDVPLAFRDRSIPWFYEYVDLYHGFLRNHETYPVLKDPKVIEESKKMKGVFLSNFSRETPRILLDIPNLYSEEKGRALGDYLF